MEDRRVDWVEATITRLARTHGVVIVENLRIRNLVGLNKRDSGLGVGSLPHRP